MTTTRTLLKIHAPVPVTEPRGAIVAAAIVSTLSTLLRNLRAAAHTVANASRASRGGWVD